MKAFTFHNGELTKGIVTSSGDEKKQGKFVFLGEAKSNVRLNIDADSPPTIIDRMVYDAFPSITPRSERPVLSKPQRESLNVLLRINTSSPNPESRRSGNWLQTGGRVEKIAYARGKGWKDDIIKLQSGCNVIVTVQGGKKYAITNYKEKIYCAEVHSIFSFKPYEDEHPEELYQNDQFVHTEQENSETLSEIDDMSHIDAEPEATMENIEDRKSEIERNFSPSTEKVAG